MPSYHIYWNNLHQAYKVNNMPGQDMHYYCIGVLARSAGFKSEDALIIAYASQYVDDATESERIKIKVEGGYIDFDPVRTAHIGLEAINWSVQKRIYIPFHLIPPKPFHPQENEIFSYVTEADSLFSRLILEQAAIEPLENWKYRLCRIGVALHTYTDAWGHQGFSGRYNKENNVESIHVYDRSKSKYEKLTIENVLFDIGAQIAHTEAGYFPDITYPKWKYVCGCSPNSYIERDNIEIFLQAAHTIYNWLSTIDKTEQMKTISWETLEPKIRKLLSNEPIRELTFFDRLSPIAYRNYHVKDILNRCKQWKETFAYLFEPYSKYFSYDKETWRKAAFEGDTNWDNYTSRNWEQLSPRKLKSNFWDSLWVHFHRAALRQRHFVLENIP